MPHDFPREHLLRLPLPLAQLASRASNAKDARGRHDNAFYLFEALIKLTATPAIAAYLEEIEQGAERDPALDRLLAQLALPSLGQWTSMVRALARHFGRQGAAPAHPLEHLWKQLSTPRRDLPAILGLYRRIKNGPDGTPANNQSCSLLELFDALVQYRNGVFGHGAARFESFYENDLGPLLFPAAHEILAEGVLDFLGPPGARLVYLHELRQIADDRVEVGLSELSGDKSERMAPLELHASAAAGLAPNCVAAYWPGRAAPLRLDPLLAFRGADIAEEVLFLNRDRNGRHVEYLSYTTGRTERDRTMAPAMAALLSRITGRGDLSEADLNQLAEQSLAETASVEQWFADSGPPSNNAGDFEILAEIGRGGMGVVYLARQLSLGRIVALKTLPAEMAENETALARFRREMRALGRCEHPHIVKVLSNGTLADGQLYYAMEYIPGADLEMTWRELAREANEKGSVRGGWESAVASAWRKRHDEMTRRAARDGNVETPGRADADHAQSLPLPPLAAEAGIEDHRGYSRRVAMAIRDAALALQAMHDQGIVHRDVKPANLMITPDGSRVVLMDFGLAKGHSLAVTASGMGGLLGTLRYAAPEQLAAATLPVGPTADVRGLGVVMWELLARRRLFGEAEDERQLAQMVHEEDTPRLRTIDSSLDRDLEAIVARATERRVADRIASAAEFARYLQLYLDGLPLPIRPPGGLERAKKWGRRHPVKAVAGSIAALALLVIVIGGGVYNYLLTKAHIDLEGALGRETAEKIKVQAANRDLEEAAARSLLRPLGHQEGELTTPEVEALWELTRSSDRIRLLFVEEALRDPSTTRQLRNRADLLMHAAVGLNQKQRVNVEQLLATRLHDKQVDLALRVDYAIIAMSMDGAGADLAQAAQDTIFEALEVGSSTAALLNPAGEALVLMAPRLNAADAAEATRLSLAALRKSGNADSIPALRDALRELSHRLTSDSATAATQEALEILGNAIRSQTNAPFVGDLARIVESLAPRGESHMTAEQMRPLVDAMHSYAFPNHIYLAEAATAMSSRLAPGEDVKTVHIALESMKQAVSVVDADYSSKIVAAAAAELDELEALSAMRLALDAMQESDNAFAQVGLSKAIVTLSERTDAQAGTEYAVLAAEIVLKRIRVQTKPEWLEYALESLAPKLDAATATASADELLKSIEATQETYALAELSEKLAGVLEHVESSAAAPIAAAALVAMVPVDGPHLNRYRAAQPTVARSLASRLGPEDVLEIASITAGVMSAAPGGDNWSGLCELTSALAPRLDSAGAAATFRTLFAVLMESTDANVSGALSATLRELAVRLEPPEFAEIAKLIIDRRRATNYVDVQAILSGVLMALVQEQESAVWDAEIAAMAQESLATVESNDEPMLLAHAARDLAHLAGRLDPAQRARVAGQAAGKLQRELIDPKDVRQLERLAGALSDLTPSLDARDALQSARACVTAMDKTHLDLEIVGRLLERLDPDDPECSQIVQQVISRQTRYRQHELIGAVSRFVSQAPQARAFDVVSVLLQATHSSDDQAALAEAMILNAEAAAIKDPFVTAGADPYEYEFGPLGAPYTFLPQTLRANDSGADLPGRFTNQQLLKLLKLPTCRRGARQVLLRQLGRQCGEEFDSVVKFEAWVRAHPEKFDLAAPPERTSAASPES